MAKYKGIDKNILFAIIFFLSIGILVLYLGTIDKRSNEEKVLDSIIKTTFLDSFDYTCIIDFNSIQIEEDELISDFLKDTSLNLQARYNEQSKEIELDFDILIRKISVLNGTLYSNDDNLCIHIPLLYNKPIYAKWKDIEGRYGFNKEHFRILFFSIKDNMSIKAYKTIREFEADKYIEYVKEFISSIMSSEVKKELVNTDDKIIQCKKYILNSDINDWEGFLDKILLLILEDKKLELFMNRYNLIFLFDKDTIEELNIKDYLDFKVNSNLYIDEKDVVRKNQHKVYINSKNSFNKNIELEGNIEIIYKKSNEEVIFKGINLTDGINLLEINENELAILKKEIQDTITNIRGNYQ